MHIFFSGIGGGGIGPLALIATQAGYEVSGSDKQESAYTKQLRDMGVPLHIGQTTEAIAETHNHRPIDWLVYSSAISREHTAHPELHFAETHHIKMSKRDELLNKIIDEQNLKLIGIAGTHGKSTTTAMAVWLFHRLNIPIGHSVGAKIPFGPMGQLLPGSEYFVYECDEFDYNFLAFHPYMAVITGIGWDHHEIFPTEETYKKAYRDFIGQSRQTILWRADNILLGLPANDSLCVLNEHDARIHQDILLAGTFNRLDAWQAVQAVHQATGTPVADLVTHINRFPGLKQRMEMIAPHLYSNYAHTPEKIKGGMSTALELAKKAADTQNVVVIYEPLTNRRQHYIKDDYKDSFAGAKKVYWIPSYLAREDPTQHILTPAELIPYLDDPSIAIPAQLDDTLLHAIRTHLAQNDMVVAMGASGAGSLDEWLRAHIESGAL